MPEEKTIVSLATATAGEVIAELGMQPHPEGGHFVEIFRDRPSTGERGAVTSIYFLLKSGEVSRWHRVDAVEIWNWYAGAPLKLAIAELEGVPPKQHLLGSNVLAGARPQVVVPANAWQSARTPRRLDAGGLHRVAGLRVFEGFELAPDGWEPDSRACATEIRS